MRTSVPLFAGIWFALGVVASAQTTPPPTAPPAEPQADAPATSVAPIPVSDILEAIPAEAKLVLVVRDMAELDAKLTALSRQAAFMPISGLTLAKGWLEMVAGMQDNAPLALLLMPAEPEQMMFANPVLLVPTVEREALLRLLHPEPVLEDYVRVKLRGQESYAGTKGKFTVFGPTLAAVKSVVAASPGSPARLTSYQRARLHANDATLWVDVPWLMERVAEGAPSNFLAETLGPGFLKQLKSLQLGLRVEPPGLALEFCAESSVAPAPAAAASPSPSLAADSLLTGLPAEQYVWALGITGETALPLSNLVLEQAVRLLGGYEQEAPERVARFRQTLASLATMSRRGAVSVALLPEGPYGRIGLTKVVETSGASQSALEEFAAFVRQLPEAPLADLRIKALLQRVSYQRGAETGEDLSIDHFRLDLTGLDSVDTEAVGALLGSEGVLFRIASAGDTRFVVALGGGRPRFEAALAAARSGQAPLAADVGIVRTAPHLPGQRQVEGYLALDQGLRLGKLLEAAWGQADPLKPSLTLPAVHAPVAFAVRSVGDAAWQVDVFVPVELLSAVRQAVMDSLAREMKFTR